MSKIARYIILDTNIISAFSNKSASEKIIEILKNVRGLNYGIAFSDYTLYEILCEATFEKEEIMIEALKGLRHYSVKKENLIAAAHLSSLYKDEGLQMTQINDGDRIIAATAIMTNSIIFTENGRDFPQPFFKELGRETLIYKGKNNNDVCKILYFMDPQLEYINKCHEDRQKPYLEKKQNQLEKFQQEALTTKSVVS